jgi:hypothetical protein
MKMFIYRLSTRQKLLKAIEFEAKIPKMNCLSSSWRIWPKTVQRFAAQEKNTRTELSIVLDDQASRPFEPSFPQLHAD